MAVVVRASHWTDNAIGGRDHTRTIGNWLNYVLPSGLIDACAPDVEALSLPPPGWTGAYEFTHGSRRAALQVHVGDSTDAANTALLGVRLSARPECWLNIKAINVNPVPMVVSRIERSVSWAGLWDFTALRWTLGRSRVAKEILLSGPGHPAGFRFALRYPAGFSHVIGADGSVSYRDASGTEWLRSPAPWAEDAKGKRIRVACVAAPDIVTAKGTFPTFRLVPNATDLASAVYPVRIDPTATISGTTAIEDNLMRSLVAGNTQLLNYGGFEGHGVGYEGASAVQREVVRVAAASIPAGTISAFRFLPYRYSQAIETAAGTLLAYIIKDANTWVEGTASGAQQAGSSCWAYAKLTSQAWAGSAGCDTSGTDYDADASPPSLAFDAYSSGPDVLQTMVLEAAWATAWRDGARVANGFLLLNQTETTAGSYWSARSTEAASNQPTFEIDYSVIASKPGYYKLVTTRRRR